MGPHRSKKHHGDWQFCNNCGGLSYYKESSFHSAACTSMQERSRSKNTSEGFVASSFEEHLFSPKELLSLNHNFIFKETLHGEVVVTNGDDMDYLPRSKSNVFMHPSTMKLCKIINGSYVIINGVGETSVYVAWSRCSVKHTSVVFLDKYVKYEPKSKVTVRLYSRKIGEAGKIYILPSCQEDIVFDEAFKQSVCRHIWDLHVCVGMTFTFKYQGIICEFTIKHISEFETLSDVNSHDGSLSDCVNQLTGDISNLSLIDACSEDKSTNSFDEAFDLIKVQDFKHPKMKFLCSTPRPYQPDCFESSCTEYSDSSPPVKRIISQAQVLEKDYFQVTPLMKIIIENNKENKRLPVCEPVMFKDIGGLGEQINQIKVFLDIFLGCQNVIPAENGKPGGILFTGPSGTGKSFVAEAIKNEYDMHFIRLNAPELFHQYFAVGEHALRSIFKEARDRAPSIVFLDELDVMCRWSSKLDKGIIATLIYLVDEFLNDAGGSVLLGAAKGLNEIDAALADKFCKEIKFPVPNSDGRTEILTAFLEDEKHNLSEKDISELAICAHGCTGFDLNKICMEAKTDALMRCAKLGLVTEEDISNNLIIKYSDVKYYITQKKPNAMRDKVFEVQKIKYSDIGGMYDVKEKLKQAIEWPLKYPQLHQRFDATPTHGILLHGPPGCSKTMIVKALATESNLNFIPIRGSELLSKWLGESEKAVRELFRSARAAAPCIIFFDEIDALVDKRGSGSDVGSRVVTQLLTEIDGVEMSEGVIIVAATNRPDMIDDAMMRNRRFDHLIYVSLPNAESRTEIFKLKLATMAVSKDINIETLVEKTDGYSGAEIIAVCHEAAFLALTVNWPQIVTKPVILSAHLEEALTTVLPRTSKETIEICERFSSKHKYK